MKTWWYHPGWINRRGVYLQFQRKLDDKHNVLAGKPEELGWRIRVIGDYVGIKNDPVKYTGSVV